MRRDLNNRHGTPQWCDPNQQVRRAPSHDERSASVGVSLNIAFLKQVKTMLEGTGVPLSALARAALENMVTDKDAFDAFVRRYQQQNTKKDLS